MNKFNSYTEINQYFFSVWRVHETLLVPRRFKRQLLTSKLSVFIQAVLSNGNGKSDLSLITDKIPNIVTSNGNSRAWERAYISSRAYHCQYIYWLKAYVKRYSLIHSFSDKVSCL